jgi:hypothetical protein
MTPQQSSAQIRSRWQESLEAIADIVPAVPPELFFDMAERIARTTLIPSRSQQSKQLKKGLKALAKGLSKMIDRISSIEHLSSHLSPHLTRDLGLRDRKEWLAAFCDAVGQQRVLVPRQPRGRLALRLNKHRNDLAAHASYSTLRRPDANIVPDLELTGPFITLSGIIIYIALGTEPNMYHVCRKVFNWYEAQSQTQ